VPVCIVRRTHPPAPAAAIPDLLDKRLLFVTGKGGTGKTTVSAALGMAAARAGVRTIVCEVARQHRLIDTLGPGGAGAPLHQEVEVAPGLAAISIDPDRAVEEYLRLQMPSRRLADFLAHNRLFEALANATPGLRELVTVGKAWELAQPARRTEGSAYDLVIVDAPATGHGLGLLRAPRTFRDAARAGPVSRQAGTIDSFLADPGRTGVLAVALPEELPVTETLELGMSVREQTGRGLDAVVVNGLWPERFSSADAELIERAASGDEHAGGPAARAALRAALAEHARARMQRSELRRLRRGAAERLAGTPVATLPFLFEPELAEPEIERLSRELERRL
jgi:hypothetical protein